VIVRNEELLKLYRGPGPCGFCGRWCRGRQACHIQPKGRGRVDHPFNLIAMPWFNDCQHHLLQHTTGKPSEGDLVLKVSGWEMVPVDVIGTFMDRVRAEPKCDDPIRRAEEIAREVSRGFVPDYPRAEGRDGLPGFCLGPAPRRGPVGVEAEEE
jgi:hypothetical protein